MLKRNIVSWWSLLNFDPSSGLYSLPSYLQVDTMLKKRGAVVWNRMDSNGSGVEAGRMKQTYL
jgi:hypothetical protein